MYPGLMHKKGAEICKSQLFILAAIILFYKLLTHGDSVLDIR